MTKRTVLVAAMSTAAVLAGAAPIVGQMTMPGMGSTEGAVNITDAGYAPGTVVAAPGHHVTWTNGGSNPHTVTANDGSFDSGTLGSKAKFDFMAPATTGTFPYHCTFHSFMNGTLVVSTLSLEGPTKAVLVGKGAQVHGAAPGGAPGTPVTIEALTGATWAPVASTTLAADGTYRVRTSPLKRLSPLRARIGEDLSPTFQVAVAPKVAVKKAKAELTINVTVTPARAGTARLEKLNSDTFRWSKVRAVPIPRSGKATVKVPKAGGTFRVTVVASKDLAAASSPTIKFR